MEYEKFVIEPEPTATGFYNVLVRKNRTSKETGKQYSDTDSIAYGVPFQRALEIVAHRAADKTTIQGFIDDFQRITNELRGL